MTLATTCPGCGTTFRIVPDQLKLRRGLVRCGMCRQVFSAHAGLRTLDTATPAPSRASPSDELRIERQPETIAAMAPVEPARQTEPPAVTTTAQATDTLGTGVEFRLPEDTALTRPTSVRPVVQPPEERPPRRRALVATWSLAMLLLAALGLQAALGARDLIAARHPLLAPLLRTIAAPFGLEVKPPMRLTALAIASFTLEPAARPGLFAMRALIRNEARHPVRLPGLDLTLNDAEGRMIARRTLRPEDYLETGHPALSYGLGAHRALQIFTALEIDGPAPAGYDVRLSMP